MLFRNRNHAGAELARELLHYKGENPLLLAVPRGGVPVAWEIHQVTGGCLDLVISRKLPAPNNPEFAVGAVAPDGTTVLDKKTIENLGLSRDYIEKVKEEQVQEIQRRLNHYRGQRPYPPLTGETVIVVDDGVATGATLRAALRMVGGAGAKRLVLAVPVGPAASIKTLGQEVDELVCLATPEPFYAVGQFYRDFQQMGDGEVIAILQRAWEKENDPKS